MITELQARTLEALITLVENDAFLCGEAAGTNGWMDRYHSLLADRAEATAFIKSLTVQDAQLNSTNR
jgi:hypothetical protein